MGRPLHHPAMEDITLDAVLHALSDPARRSIVAKLLAHEGMSCSDAADPSMPASTLSYHYKILRDAGVIRSKRQGTALRSTVRRAELERLFPRLLSTIMRYHPAAADPPLARRLFRWSKSS